LLWKCWSPDDGAWDLAEELHSLLLSADDDDKKDEEGIGGKKRGPQSRILVYVHCMRGIDRTGLAVGAYLARFQNFSSEEIDRGNWAVGRREINWPARNALRWVVWRNREKEGMI